MPLNLAERVYPMWTQAGEASADFETRYASLLQLIANGYSSFINVQNPKYGVDATGVADARGPMQAAITDALVGGGSGVVIPYGIYNLLSLAPTFADRILTVANAGAQKRIQIIGIGRPVLTTPLCPAAGSAITLHFSGGFESPTVEGIEFRNTHGPTDSTTVAIYGGGDGSQSLKHMKIRGCIFRDHARTIDTRGVDGLTVENNDFLFTNGHDSGNTTGGGPNVGLWCMANTYGPTSNVRVAFNFYDGCTSGDVSANVTKTGMDGFVYGEARGWAIIGNTIKRFGFEGIYVRNRGCATDNHDTTQYPCVISGNTLDAMPVTGDVGYGQTGIRCDESDASIVGNSIVNAARGILSAPMVECPALGASRLNIADNTISMMDSTKGNSIYGIEVLTCQDFSLHNNRITWGTAATVDAAGLKGILVGDSQRGRITNNLVRFGTNPAALTTGLFFQSNTCADIYVAENEFDNVDQVYWAAANMLTVGVIEIARNTYRRVGTNYFAGTNLGAFAIIAGYGDAQVEYTGINSKTIKARFNRPIQHITGVLAANITVTLSRTEAIHGDRFRVVNRATGAFTVTVADSNGPTTIGVIAASTKGYIEAIYDRAFGWLYNDCGTLV